MAKAICNKSGLQFTVEYFPYNFDEGQLQHPIFTLNYSELTKEKLLNKWVNREFTDVDTRLYFLALLHSSNLVEWRTYARPTLAICEANMEALLDILDWMNCIQHPKLSMPHVTISQDTATLDNVRNWIAAWNIARQEFESGYRELSRTQLLLRKEDTLQRLIRTQQKELTQFGTLLADWAMQAAEFPTFNTVVNGVSIPLNEHWKQIIITCGKTPAHIWRLDIDDINELIEHLEDNLEHGNIYAHAVMKLLRDAVKTHQNYLGFSIIDSAEDIERANFKLLADTAPINEPRIQDYPNKILYLKDKIRWEQAQKLLAQSTTQDTVGGIKL